MSLFVLVWGHVLGQVMGDHHLFQDLGANGWSLHHF